MTPAGEPQWCRETVVAPSPGEGSGRFHGVLTFIGQRVQIQNQMEVAARNTALRGASARLAHDLNNPLMLIAGYAEEMLRAFPEGDARRDDAEQIIKATERIADLTSRLLRFTRRGATNPGSVDLPALVGGLDPKFARICGDGVAIRIQGAATERQRPEHSRKARERPTASTGPSPMPLRSRRSWPRSRARRPRAPDAPNSASFAIRRGSARASRAPRWRREHTCASPCEAMERESRVGKATPSSSRSRQEKHWPTPMASRGNGAVISPMRRRIPFGIYPLPAAL